MELRELDRLARSGEVLPDNMTFYETAYCISARGLYRQYDREEISLEQAREEKEIIIKQYEENKEIYQFLIMTQRLEVKLKQLCEQGFDSVLEWEILEELKGI